jgi:purine-binding chemotaxis protein CheW
MTFQRASEAVAHTEAAGKYLTFALGGEFYGIPVLKVREIIKLIAITAVPQMPSDIKGVINLRGKIIPVVDLRTKFGLALANHSEQTCIVVVQVGPANSGKLHLGLIVDAVEEVTSFVASDIEEAPEFGTRVDTTYILGMAKVKDTVKVLLDIDRLLVEETQLQPTHPV